MASWNAGLPSEFMEEGYDETLPDGTIRFGNDIGPASVRRVTSANITKIKGQMLLTSYQTSLMTTQYQTTCAFGATAVTWVHPRTGVVADLRFTAPPHYTPAGGNYYIAQLEMEILP
ncbi:MAG TPA: hypothetical protein PLQ68_04600 [Clostridia bacterium]|nr:hypothetical protein [Clostridia bacterium]